MIRVIGPLALLLLLANACNTVSCACVPTLEVRGAASLAGALDDMKSSHPGFYSNVHLIVGTGSSTAIRTQIEENNTAADVFLAADTINPQVLVDAGLTDGPPVPFATNALTIIVPEGNPAGIQTAADLARENLRIIAAADGVPITSYAQQVVDELAALPGYPPDFSELYRANVVSREDNVGAVLAKVALGEGDAAIVYVTDTLSAEVDSIEIPAEANVEAVYAGVVIAGPRTPEWAHEFLNWLRGADGQAILQRHGFSPTP